MKSTSAPALISVPFADQGSKNTIPVDSQIGITDGAASYTDGFPPLTMTPVAAGGIPPAGGDFNGILNAITQSLRWVCAGGQYAYNSSFSTAIDGYPKGALLQNSSADVLWLNLNDDNKNDPATGTDWVPVIRYGKTTVALAAANVTLTAEQAAKETIVLTGALTANVSLIMPAWVETWLIINNTTGNFTVSIKTASGSGVNLSAGTTSQIYGDGTSIYYGALMVRNNLAEIKAAGTNSQIAARGNIGCGTAAALDATTSTTDNTVGHVLKVGDRGIAATGVAAIVGFDFNTYIFAASETLLIDMSKAINVPGELSSLSTSYVYLNVTGVRDALNGYSFTLNEYFTKETWFCIRENDAGAVGWVIAKLPTIADDVLAVPSTVRGIISDNGSFASAGASGFWLVNVQNPDTVAGFPKYQNGNYLYTYGIIFVTSDNGNPWQQTYYANNGEMAWRQGWAAGPDTATTWVVPYSPVSPPPATDLSGYVTKSAAYSTFLQGIRMANYGSYGSEGISDSSHKVITGIYATNGWDNPSTQEARTQQFNINGSWYDIGYV